MLNFLNFVFIFFHLFHWNAPTPADSFQIQIIATHPSCTAGTADGVLKIYPSNGQPPFLFILNDTLENTTGIFENLPSGNYHIYVEDDAGCTVEEEKFLGINIMIDDIPDIYMGEQVQIDIQFSNFYDSLKYEPKYHLSCIDCPNPIFNGLDSQTYTVTFFRDDCISSAQFSVNVKPPNIFIPNVFTPNGDGTNEFLPVFSSSGVKIIKSFKLYTRRGKLIYWKQDFLPNNPRVGWDGTGNENDHLYPQGVYRYVAKIVNLKGVAGYYYGEVNLIR